MQLLVDRLGPNADARPVGGRFGINGVLRKSLIEVFADHRRFRNHHAVVHKRRHDGFGIDLQVSRTELLAFEEIEIAAVPIQPLLRQRQTDLGRTRRRAVMVEFKHCASRRLGPSDYPLGRARHNKARRNPPHVVAERIADYAPVNTGCATQTAARSLGVSTRGTVRGALVRSSKNGLGR
jgi:hypothetical protein